MGKVYLVGAGPGDPDLLTVRAARLLATADCVVYDRLIPPLAYLPMRPDVRRIDVGKEPTRHRRSQADINAILVAEARAGHTVVRLKGGDCFVFGRGGEEALELAAAGIPFEVVPGVTSAIAVPAYAGIPVTHRHVSTEFAVVTGHEDPDKEEATVDWAHLARGVGTVVFLMGVKNLQRIVDLLVAHGRPPETPAAIIHRGCSSAQRVLVAPLAELPHHPDVATFVPPSITVVGEVVALRSRIGPWFERLPLFGRRFLCTRPLEYGGRDEATALVRLGADAVCCPLVTVVERPEPAGLPAAVDGLATGAYGWVVFTSANGVRFFFDRLHELGRDARCLGSSRLAAIGSATAAALAARGLRADLVPSAFTAEGLLEDLPSDLRGTGVLVPRSAQARPTLVDGLTARGARVDELSIYDTVAATALTDDGRQALVDGTLTAVPLYSPSAAQAFADLTTDVPRRPPCVTVGPITGRRARELGLDVAAEAEDHDRAGVERTLLRLYGGP